MDLKILMVILVYWGVITLVFWGGLNALPEYTTTANISGVGNPEASDLDKGGLFGSGIDFGRYLLFVNFGIGLPADTPGWFSFMFFLWQTGFSIFVAGWVISSIWNG